MPTTPQPGDPSYVEWLRMANSYGMTVDELYQAMVSYPAEQGAGYGYPQLTQGPALDPTLAQPPAPAYDYANRTPAQPPAPAIGMYEGQPYEGYSPWNPISRMFQGAEVVARMDIEREGEYLQNMMNDYHKGLANAQANNVQAEVDFYTNRILQTRTDYAALVQKAQTGAGGFRAAGKIASQPGLAGSYGELAEQLPGGFLTDLPLALTEPPNAVEGYKTPTGKPMTAKPSGPQEPAYPAPSAFGQVPANVGAPTPMPAFGRVPENVGARPFTPPAPYASPAAPAGDERYFNVQTPDDRGFATWGALRTGMEGAGQWNPESWNEDLRMWQGGTNIPQGGDPASLRNYIGGSGAKSTETFDIGQGRQNYIVRRDSMGNIRSFTPTSSIDPSTKERMRQPWFY